MGVLYAIWMNVGPSAQPALADALIRHNTQTVLPNTIAWRALKRTLDGRNPMSNLVDQRLGAAIRAYRVEAGQGTQELAQALGRSAEWLSDLEAGRVRITAVWLGRVSSALHTTSWEILQAAEAFIAA
jgi:ribosome-binding protein aMBF1 (putative translation factor)